MGQRQKEFEKLINEHGLVDKLTSLNIKRWIEFVLDACDILCWTRTYAIWWLRNTDKSDMYF